MTQRDNDNTTRDVRIRYPRVRIIENDVIDYVTPAELPVAEIPSEQWLAKV